MTTIWLTGLSDSQSNGCAVERISVYESPTDETYLESYLSGEGIDWASNLDDGPSPATRPAVASALARLLRLARRNNLPLLVQLKSEILVFASPECWPALRVQ